MSFAIVYHGTCLTCTAKSEAIARFVEISRRDPRAQLFAINGSHFTNLTRQINYAA